MFEPLVHRSVPPLEAIDGIWVRLTDEFAIILMKCAMNTTMLIIPNNNTEVLHCSYFHSAFFYFIC